MGERNEYDEHNGQTEVAEQSRPEYVDFTVDDFPGGLAACLEAILMVADQPQTVEDMARVLVVDESDVEDALQALRTEYEGDAARGIRPRGFELRHTARGWQFANRAEFEPVVSAFVTDGFGGAGYCGLPATGHPCAGGGNPWRQLRWRDSLARRARPYRRERHGP